MWLWVNTAPFILFPQQAIGGKIKTQSSAIRLCIWSRHQLLAYVFGSFSFLSFSWPSAFVFIAPSWPSAFVFTLVIRYLLGFTFFFFFFWSLEFGVWSLEFGVLIECGFTLFWVVMIVRQNDHWLIFSYFGSLSAVHISNFFRLFWQHIEILGKIHSFGSSKHYTRCS